MNTIINKKTAINKLRQMIQYDHQNEVKYLYQNNKDFMSAREYLRLRLQQVINK